MYLIVLKYYFDYPFNYWVSSLVKLKIYRSLFIESIFLLLHGYYHSSRP